MLSLLHISILLFVCNTINAQIPRCKDENNRAVDWYVLYKLPKVAESSNSAIRNGTGYLYITSNTVSKGWQLSKKMISAKDSIPGNTLASLYNNSVASKAFWILYNDSPPNRNSSAKYGHAKGVVLTNPRGGLWLIHSVPNFPPLPDTGDEPKRRQRDKNVTAPGDRSEYAYPLSGMHYGQSFLCISIDSNQFDLIGRQLIYNQIIIYKRNIPNFARKFPVLVNAAKQKRIKEAPYNSKVLLKSSGSVEFLSFAKSDKWDQDLYDNFVAPQLQTDLFAETWLNGRGRLPSDCAGAKVYNIMSINLDTVNVEFKSSRDHSKWAVGVENKANHTWTCVGDINRAGTQYTRGGGTVCFNMRKVWQNYRNAVNDVEPCPKRVIRI